MKNLSDLCSAACSLLQILLHRSLPVISVKLLIVPSMIKSLSENAGIHSPPFSNAMSTYLIFCRIVELGNSLPCNWSNMGDFSIVIRTLLYLLQNCSLINGSKVWIFKLQHFCLVFCQLSCIKHHIWYTIIIQLHFNILLTYFFNCYN